MIIPFGFLKQPSSEAPLYNNVSVIYTLRTPVMTTLWSNSILKLRRSSDNQTAFVFIDGSGVNDTITLSSLISTSSNTTPSATLLSAWIGSNDGFVEEWLGITTNNLIDNNKVAKETTASSQPQFISSGVIITKNGLPAIDFLSSTRTLDAEPNADLDSGETFTILTVSAVDAIGTRGYIMSTNNGTIPTSSRLSIANDRTSGLVIINIRNDSLVNNILLTLSLNDTGNQKLITVIVKPTSFDGYLNGAIQEDSRAWTGSYLNVKLRIGSQHGGNTPLDGTIQEIIMFPSNKTDDLITLNSDIDTYYSIP